MLPDIGYQHRAWKMQFSVIPTLLMQLCLECQKPLKVKSHCASTSLKMELKSLPRSFPLKLLKLFVKWLGEWKNRVWLKRFFIFDDFSFRPIASFRLVAKVQALPRTRSGKTMRKALADFARNKTVNLPATIEDPTVFIDIRRALNELGYATSAPSPLLGYKKRD